MMVKIGDKEKCSGCGACAQVCPVNCIEMRHDREGFIYPFANVDKCVECGRCNDICPIDNIAKEKDCSQIFKEPQAFAARIKDDVIREDSSSGGIFSLVANYILEEQGYVYGCILNDKLEAVHIGISSKEELHAMRGSKYVQSVIGDTYEEVKKNLKLNKKVLFVGTPCQAAGLYSYLDNKKYPNLVIIDFICHGVPSPMIFKDYIKMQEKQNNSKITEFRFRNKDKGWNQSGLQLGTKAIYENKMEVRKYPAFKDRYMNAFLDDICLRPSCYNCNFKSVPKVYADITIADFWGINKIDKKMNDKKGLSLVLINSENGKKIWDIVSEKAEFSQYDFETAIKKNPPLIKSAKNNSSRDKFFNDYDKKGYLYVEKKYMSAFKWAQHKVLKILLSYLKKFEQFIKFSIVGLSNTIINLFVYYILIFLRQHYLIAYTAGFLVSVCNAFYWNNKYVFKNKQENSILRAFMKVLASYGVTFLLSVIMMSIIVEILKIPSVIAPILKMIVTIPLNFILNKVWAFKDKQGNC